ncbi:MAG: FHA domain-containing protein [Gemmataceae bacterium]
MAEPCPRLVVVRNPNWPCELYPGVTPLPGDEFPIPEGVTGVGRDGELRPGENAVLHLHSHVPAARHARLTRTADAVTVEDCRSRGGSFVNGRRVAAPVRLADEDRISLGCFVFRFRA